MLGAIHKIKRLDHDLIVDGFHAFARQWPGVGDLAPSKAVDHAAWTKAFFKFWVFGVIRVFGFFFGIQMIEIAKKLIKAVRCRQHVVTIT